MVWLIYSSNSEINDFVVGVATTEDKAYEMVKKLEAEFEDAFEYYVVCIETNKLTINDEDIRF